MLRHYITVAVRNLVRHRLYSFINVLGLSVALTCVIFVVLFARYQLSYDQWLPGTENLYRVESTLRMPGKAPLDTAMGSYPVGIAMRDQIPGVSAMTHIATGTLTLIQSDRQFLETKADFVDPNFFRLFRLPFVAGDPDSALREPESVVLTESAAKRYFGNTDPIGRTLTTAFEACPNNGPACAGKSVLLRVTGVVRDLPQNTQLTGSVFIPSTSQADGDVASVVSHLWFYMDTYTYVTLAPGVKPAAVLAALQPVLDRDMTGVMRQTGVLSRGSQAYAIHLTPFAEVHLGSSGWRDNMTPPGSWETVYGAITIGILILLVACFNFINLATARATLRAREIGLRKTLGGTRRQLTVQFLAEALLLALLSLACAAAAAEILLPAFRGLLGQPLVLDCARDWRLDLMILGIAVAAGLVSGIYPALVLSRLRPVAALQPHGSGLKRPGALRDVLVLTQFAVSIALGIAAIVVFRQVNYARSLDLGFNRDNVVVIEGNDLGGQREQALAQALRANPGVNGVGLSAFLPFETGALTARIQVPGQSSVMTLDLLPIDPGYPQVYGIALVAGRMLSIARGDDRFSNTNSNTGRDILVNAAGARRLGFTPRQAVGQSVVLNAIGDHVRVHIVGVMADANTQGARQPVAPTVYLYFPDYPMAFSVRLRPGSMPQTLAFIDRTWRTFEPMNAIQRSFLSANFAELYQSDQRQGTVFGVFVIIAIVIGCLGLYGLVVFTAQRRTKEVGIRKVSGARTADILRLMLWRISVPVVLANLIAWPVAYYYLSRWLEGYAYRIALSPLYFLAAGTGALLIAWATVYANTLRLARASPIHALRYE
ncbi:MAG TPA: ABC transporter permease [Steroidobacteraceae bacterium]|jgi:putative ABC transport system permease protein